MTIKSSKMLEEYDHLLNFEYDKDYKIPLQPAETRLFRDGREKISLEGKWNFSQDVFDTFLRKKFFEEKTTDEKGRAVPVDFDFWAWEQTEIPSHWNVTHKELSLYEGSVIYTRTFSLPQWRQIRANNASVFLYLAASNYETRVWINQTLVGRHQGGFTPFYFDVTSYLQGENRIIIQVNNQRKAEQIPSLNYDWFNYGGIYRSIELLIVPQIHIKDFFAYLVPDQSFRHIQLEVELNQAFLDCWAEVSIPEIDFRIKIPFDSQGKAQQRVDLKLDLWSPETPKLYRVCCKIIPSAALVASDKIGDQVETKMGFRELRIDGANILLNGQELFLKGICCHEEVVEVGRGLSQADRKQIFNHLKELNANAIRLAHYPHSEEMTKMADEMGFLLWEEIPVYWALDFDNPATLFDAQNQMKELIYRDRNRASVIIWSVGNENPDTDQRYDFMKSLIDITRGLDPSRPISAACLVNVDEMKIVDRLSEIIDIVAFNEYYGWYYRDYEDLAFILTNTHIKKPLFISETGAGAKAGYRGGDETLFTEEHQALMYQKQIEISDQKIQGFFPWILYDFRSPIRLNGFQQGFNRKGLVAEDRKQKKLAFDVLAKYYQQK